MSWTFNGTRIYTNSFDESNEQIIARLQPIAAGTILHNFGYTEDIVKLSALVATETDKDALKALAKTGLSYTLVGPEGTVDDYFVKSVSVSRTSSTCIKLFDRPALDTDAPIYQVEMELYLDA